MASRLDSLLAAAERLTVDLIAQTPVTVSPSRDTPGIARHVADRENFDVLPFEEDDGRIVRYVRRGSLDVSPSDTEWTNIDGELFPRSTCRAWPGEHEGGPLAVRDRGRLMCV